MRCFTTGTTVWSTIASVVVCCASLRGADRVEASEPHMGTLFRIVLYADDPAPARAAIRRAFDRIAELDNRLSDYKPESELNRACREAVGRDVPISEDLFTVLRAADGLAQETEGAFDVTVGSLMREWRLGRIPSRGALAAVGYRNLHLGAGTLRLDSVGTQIDLGAIAKGYAADQALAVLRARGFPRALVAASGDIAFGDAPPGKSGWTTGVDSFRASPDWFTRVIELSNAAISTSGDTEQFRDIGGTRYSHIVDPRTGLGLTKRIGVTVVARKGIDSDSLATAASVVTARQDAQRALALIRGRGANGIIVTEAGTIGTLDPYGAK